MNTHSAEYSVIQVDFMIKDNKTPDNNSQRSKINYKTLISILGAGVHGAGWKPVPVGKFRMKKAIFTVLASAVVISMLLLPVAATDDTHWSHTFIPYGYSGYNGGPDKLQIAIYATSGSGDYQINMSAGLAISVEQYEAIHNYNSVNMDVGFVVHSECGQYAQFSVDAATVFIEKDTGGCAWNKQAIEFMRNVVTPDHPYNQGYNFVPLGENTALQSTEKEDYALKAISWAVDIACPEAGLALTLVDLGTAYLLQSSGPYVNAGYSSDQLQAKFMWSAMQGAKDNFVASTSNYVQWEQDYYYNPQTWMGIKVYVVFSCFCYPYGAMASEYTVGPLYLRINHMGTSGGGCPYLTVWDGNTYAAEGLLNIHNPEGQDVIVQHTLTSVPKAVNGQYLLQLTEESNHYSEIDNVKLIAFMKDGTNKTLPLLSALHSVYGSVKDALSNSDDVRTVILGQGYNNTEVSQYITLGFNSRCIKPDDVSYFVFQIEGFNQKLE